MLRELKVLAWSNVSNYAVDENGILGPAEGVDASVMAAVSAVKYTTRWEREGETKIKVTTCEFRLWDKPGSLKLAGRHLGLFPDRVPDDRVEETAAKMLQASVEKARRELEARAIDVTATEVPG